MVHPYRWLELTLSFKYMCIVYMYFLTFTYSILCACTIDLTFIKQFTILSEDRCRTTDIYLYITVDINISSSSYQRNRVNAIELASAGR